MRRHAQTPIEISHERWLISYADFITLLFAFFVVMYAISQVNENKYRVLSTTLSAVFDVPKRTLAPIQIGELARASEAQVIDTNDINPEARAQGAFDKTAELAQLSDQFTEQFADLIDDKLVQVNSNEYWLQIVLNNSLLFPLGSIKLSIEADTLLTEVADILRGFNNPIQVEGYTDTLPVASLQFPSNWELSSARAAAVVKHFIDVGIAPTRLAAVGYGEYQPIAENQTPAGRAQNRRITLMVAREKMQRPRLTTQSAVDAIVKPSTIEQTQVHPQPGLYKREAADGQQTAKTAMERLLEDNPGMGIESLFQQHSPAAKPPVVETDKIQPVTTPGGGLLFSSDPELPRKSR